MSRIIVLQACRHGIGCSHLVANLAVMLMQRGYRVGLLDTDPRGGGIRTLFGLDETAERDLKTYWWLSPSPLPTTALHPELRRYEVASDTNGAGIYLTPVGGQFSTEGTQLQALQQHYGQSRVRDVLVHLSQDLRLDYLFIDNQPEMSDDTLMGLSLADMTLLLLQLDVYDFQRAAVVLEVIHRLAPLKTWLVPTLVLPDIETRVVKQKLENTYQQPVIGVLHLSEEMVQLASGGVFCLHYPGHALTRTMNAIARQIEQESQAMLPPESRPSAQGQRGRSRPQRLLNLLEFPALERKLLTAVLRQGPLDIDVLIEQSGSPTHEVQAGVADLIEQGWLVQDPATQKVRYRSAEPASRDDPGCTE